MTRSDGAFAVDGRESLAVAIGIDALVGAVIWEGRRVAKKNVFISFDFDHDRDYRYLLKAFSANQDNEIQFTDSTPGAINTSDIGRVKAHLTTKIREATHILVLVGEYANTRHHDAVSIGTRNWQWWEIEKGISEGDKKFVGVKLDASNPAPDPLLGIGARWAAYKVEDIARALREA